jgi:hypothetical protein
MNYKDYYTELVSMGDMFSAPQPDFDTYGTHNEDPHGPKDPRHKKLAGRPNLPKQTDEECVDCMNEEIEAKFIEFAKTRMKGASDISTNAKEKGGDAILSHYHFDVKLPYYENAIAGKFDVDDATKELNTHIKTLTDNVGSIEQEEFQKLVGIIEVLGELIIKHNELNPLTENSNPCWKGYRMVGWKNKDGKEVPNCVPIKEGEGKATWNGIQVELGRVYSGDPRITAFKPLQENIQYEGEICEYDVENQQDVQEFTNYMREYKEELTEAEYQGRKVKLGKPVRSQDGPKKFHVFVRNPKGNVVKVNFGDPNMKIKKNISARRKSFRARHNCDNPGPRHKARYWSCKAW